MNPLCIYSADLPVAADTRHGRHPRAQGRLRVSARGGTIGSKRVVSLHRGCHGDPVVRVHHRHLPLKQEKKAVIFREHYRLLTRKFKDSDSLGESGVGDRALRIQPFLPQLSLLPNARRIFDEEQKICRVAMSTIFYPADRPFNSLFNTQAYIAA